MQDKKNLIVFIIINLFALIFYIIGFIKSRRRK